MTVNDSQIQNGWHSNPMSRQSSIACLLEGYKPRTTDSEPDQPRDGFNKPRTTGSCDDVQPRDGE